MRGQSVVAGLADSDGKLLAAIESSNSDTDCTSVHSHEKNRNTAAIRPQPRNCVTPMAKVSTTQGILCNAQKPIFSNLQMYYGTYRILHACMSAVLSTHSIQQSVQEMYFHLQSPLILLKTPIVHIRSIDNFVVIGSVPEFIKTVCCAV